MAELFFSGIFVGFVMGFCLGLIGRSKPKTKIRIDRDPADWWKKPAKHRKRFKLD